jgi:hypothetical protein
MRVAQRARRTHQVLAVFLSSFIAVGSVPWTAFAAPPKPAAPAKKPPAKKEAADPKRDEARKKYAEGEGKFLAGDWEAAYAAYKAANEAVPASQALYKMALCLERLEKPNEALSTYQAFLGSNPPAAMQPKVEEAQVRVAELKKKIPIVVKVTSDPPGGSVYVDGVVQMGTTPMEIKSPPGKHKVRVTSPGFDPFEKEVELEPGGVAITVDAVLQKTIPIAEPPPPPPAAEAKPAKPPEPPPEKHSNVAAYVVLGVAGAGAIVGTIFGVKALQEEKDFENGEKTTEKADSVEKNALIADMAFGAAITLGVTGTVLLLTNTGGGDTAKSSASKSAFQLTPVLTPQRAGAFATLRF